MIECKSFLPVVVLICDIAWANWMTVMQMNKSKLRALYLTSSFRDTDNYMYVHAATDAIDTL